MQGERTYEIHDVLGKGGFGTVYSATLRGESGFTKHVAVKILNEDIEGSSDHASRLRDEARLLGLVRHRAILHVDGLVSFGGRWAIVTEYVPGVNLLRLISRNRLPIGVALEVVAEVAGALHAALTGRDPEGRELRLVHRDIKPSNIQITRAGEVKLLDFGIAQAQFGDRESKTTDVLLGSPAYMSPEQLDMRYGPEGDVYGLGVVLCEAMTGKRFGKTSANRDLHMAHVGRVLEKVSDVLGAEFTTVEPLLRAMLAYEDRPDAHEVEARCLALRRQIGAPWLREWAQEQVEALGERGASTDELVGQVLVEGTTRAVPSPVSAPPVRRDPSQPPERTKEKKSRGKRPTWLVPFVSVGAFGVAFVATMWVSAAAFRAWMTPEAPDTSLSLVADGGAPLPDESAGTGQPVPAPAPTPAVAPAPEPPPTPPKPAPRPVAAGSGDVVSVRQFATWVGSHPEWGRDQAIAEGTADANYLRGWTGTDPPAGAGGVATNVSWAAAQEYCKGRGGLAAVGAAPREWPESEGAFQEWRADGDRPAWRRFDGATSTAVRITDANGFTGFRCAR